MGGAYMVAKNAGFVGTRIRRFWLIMTMHRARPRCKDSLCKDSWSNLLASEDSAGARLLAIFRSRALVLFIRSIYSSFIFIFHIHI
jgi:hypothetical protein